MKNELLSVVVPVYNVGEEYLKECILSIVNQTYMNLEIILVDDGSTDGSGNLIDYFARTDSRIRTIHKDNGGPYSARKRGILEATGKYLAFVDSDDVLGSQMYEHLMERIEDFDFITSDFWNFNSKAGYTEGGEIPEGVFDSPEKMD